MNHNDRFICSINCFIIKMIKWWVESSSAVGVLKLGTLLLADSVNYQTHGAREGSALPAASGWPTPLVGGPLDVSAELLGLLQHSAHVAHCPTLRKRLLLWWFGRLRLRSLHRLDDLQIVERLRRFSRWRHGHRVARRGQNQKRSEKCAREHCYELQMHCARCQVCGWRSGRRCTVHTDIS